MLQEIRQLESSIDTSNRYVTYYNYKLTDSDFGEESYVLTEHGCADIRIIISAYSKRNLNVTFNLKIYLSAAFDYISADDQYTYEGVKAWLDSTNHLMKSYSHMKFEDYYPCLVRHIDRMKFARVLK